MRIRLATVFQEEGPMIADDAIEEAGFGPEDGAWKRISDLLNEGILWDTGYRLRGRSGRLQRVLAYTDKEVT